MTDHDLRREAILHICAGRTEQADALYTDDPETLLGIYRFAAEKMVRERGEIASAIGATVEPGHTVFAIGDGSSGGLSVGRADGHGLSGDERELLVGLSRPLLDDFATQIRDAAAKRHVNRPRQYGYGF